MELIISTFQAQRILSVVKDKFIHHTISSASVSGEWLKVDFNRTELMLIMHSFIPTALDGALMNKLGQVIDQVTDIQVYGRVRIIGRRGLMPKNSLGVVKKIIEADIDPRNFLVEFEDTDYTTWYLAYEIEPEKASLQLFS